MVLKVAYDSGHGINTSGKRSPNDEREWRFNDVVATAFANELKTYSGVSLLRTDDTTGKTDVPLKTRTDKANSWGSDVYVSFHHNAYKGVWGSHTGTEVHVYTSKPSGSVALAKKVHPVVAKAYGLRDRGIKYKNLHIVRETKSTAILIEGGFMDSTIDIKKLRNNTVLKNAGKSIAKAVAEHYGLKKKSTTSKPATKPKVSGKTYKVKRGDTLYSISKASGVSVANLKKYNGLKSNLINIGQVLSLVPKTTKSSGIKSVGKIKMTGVNNFTYIYAKTSDKSKKLAKARKNAVYEIAGSVPNWYEVIYKGKRAYIKSKYASRV